MKPKSKPKIYILHGWTTSTSLWQPLIKNLKDSGFNPVLLKIPGLTAPLDQVWHLDNYVNWFASKIDSSPDLYIVAHSFGGRVALRFDIQNPRRIKKLVLIDSAGIRANSVTAYLKRLSYKAAAKIGRKITSNPKAKSLLYKLARERDYFNTSGVMRQTMSHIISEDLRPEIQYVTAPTLIIWGAEDKITPLSDGRFLHKHISGSILKIIAEARHSPHYTHPKVIASHIQDFITHSK